MSTLQRYRRFIPAAIVALAAVFAGSAFLTRADAERRTDHAELQIAEIEAQQSEVDTSLAAAQASIAESQVALDGSLADQSEVRGAVAGLTERIAEGAASRTLVLSAADTYPAQANAILNALDSQFDLARRMVSLREQQVLAGLDGDYGAFNARQTQYHGMVLEWEAVAEDFQSSIGRLASLEYDDIEILPASVTPDSLALLLPDLTTLSPPTGPARVVGSLPDTIPCSPWSDGCLWDWEITWTETNMLGAEITEIGRRYIDRWGGVWAATSGEWFDRSISIAPGGTATYDSWVRTTPDERPDLEGGTIVVSWRGVDADGNTFSGQVRARLEPRS